tara:strand:+ start:2704 stop:3279 length:576 start_codon:yes stop_codon:yes gene_type:complete
MEEIIKKAFYDSFDAICNDVTETTFRHLNESVYRYFFIKHLPSSIGIEDEWHRIDLMLHDSEYQYPIEFKQYDTRPLFMVNSKKIGKKGGAGSGNFKEFIESSKKLVELKNKEFFTKRGCNFKKYYFILLAGDLCQNNKNSTQRFDYWYWNDNRHIQALSKVGIRTKLIAKKEFTKSSLKVFGWVIELNNA